MVKGCEKRVVHLKKTDSEVFEQAFFVLKDAKTEKPPSRLEMVREANRILNENMTLEGIRCEPSEPCLHAWQACLFFLLGVGVAGALFALVFCLI